MLTWLLNSPVTDVQEKRRARWLNVLLLFFLLLTTFLALSTLVAPGSLSFAASDTFLVLIIAGIYILSRTGHVVIAAAVLTVFNIAAIIGAALTLHLTLAIVVAYPAILVVSLLIVGVFLSWRWVPAMVIVLSAITVWYYQASPIAVLQAYRTSDAAGTLALTILMPLFIAGVGALAWLSSRLISETVDDLRQRNAELERAYSELAAQTQRERELGHGINELAGQLAAVSARQVDGVSQQASAIGEVAGAIAELHATADQIGATAAEVSRAADQALTSVQRGQGLIIRSREAVERNRTQVQMVIERMNLLDELTRRITRFIGNVNKLSEETHLLALNATIEAAGAGPLGRRFGVVAAEVQNLSTRSNEIVRQIQGLIGELQRAGAETLTATQGSITVADEVEHLADEVRAAQEQVVEAVQRTTELVHLISAATTQQTTATAQMTDTIAGIAQVADATRVDTGALDVVAATLLQSSGQLISALSTHPTLGAAAE